MAGQVRGQSVLSRGPGTGHGGCHHIWGQQPCCRGMHCTGSQAAHACVAQRAAAPTNLRAWVAACQVAERAGGRLPRALVPGLHQPHQVGDRLQQEHSHTLQKCVVCTHSARAGCCMPRATLAAHMLLCAAHRAIAAPILHSTRQIPPCQRRSSSTHSTPAQPQSAAQRSCCRTPGCQRRGRQPPGSRASWRVP